MVTANHRRYAHLRPCWGHLEVYWGRVAKASECEISKDLPRFSSFNKAAWRHVEAILRPAWGIKNETILGESRDFEASGTLGFIIIIEGSQQVGTAICNWFEASRAWGFIIISTWSQLVTEDAFEKNFSPDACAKSPVSLQASCQFIFRLLTSVHFTVGKGHIAVGVGGLSRRLLNRATPYIAAAGHSPSYGANGRAADPASSDLRFSPGALGYAQLPETCFRRKSPPKERISSAPGRPHEKHHEHRFAQHPLSKIQRAGGVPEAGIKARIMSISRALGAEKPVAKRPRSYMEGPRARKLSIMSTVLPNTPSQKFKEQMLGFWGGT